MKNRLFLVGAWFVLLGNPLVYTQDRQKTEVIGDIAKLQSPSLMTRKDATREMLDTRKKTIHELLRLAGQGEKPDILWGSKALSIQILGEMRALEAVPFFIRNVTYAPPGIARSSNPIAGYPCGHALTKIGVPAFPAIWNRFRTPVEDFELMLFAYVIRRSDGEEIGLARIELARKHANNIVTVDGDVARKNLDRLLEHYKTKKTGF